MKVCTWRVSVRTHAGMWIVYDLSSHICETLYITVYYCNVCLPGCVCGDEGEYECAVQRLTILIILLKTKLDRTHQHLSVYNAYFICQTLFVFLCYVYNILAWKRQSIYYIYIILT